MMLSDGGFRRIISSKSADYQPIALRTVALDAQVGIVGHRVHGHALGVANYASGAQLFRIAVKDDFAIAVSESEVADTDPICIAEKAGVRILLGIYPPVDAVDTVSHSVNIAAQRTFTRADRHPFADGGSVDVAEYLYRSVALPGSKAAAIVNRLRKSKQILDTVYSRPLRRFGINDIVRSYVCGG